MISEDAATTQDRGPERPPEPVREHGAGCDLCGQHAVLDRVVVKDAQGDRVAYVCGACAHGERTT